MANAFWTWVKKKNSVLKRKFLSRPKSTLDLTNYIGQGNKKVSPSIYVTSAKMWVGGVRKMIILADFQNIHDIYADVGGWAQKRLKTC